MKVHMQVALVEVLILCCLQMTDANQVWDVKEAITHMAQVRLCQHFFEVYEVDTLQSMLHVHDRFFFV